MSWIRNHVRHYVVPGLKALVAAERADEKHRAAKRKKYLFEPEILRCYTDRQPPISIEDFVRCPINMRPSKGFANKELGLLWAAIKCFNFGVRWDVESAIRRNDPQILAPGRAAKLPMRHVEPMDQIHNIVKNSTKTLKRILKKNPKAKLILPGRDVWLWSVMCHKIGIPHIFDPRISRGVARTSEVLRKIVDEWKINEHTIIFDTGFAGSIFERIRKVSGINCHNLMLSTGRRSGKLESEQLYPNHKGSRGKALAIEYLPKYQKTGTVKFDFTGMPRPVQYMADTDEFIKAAFLTIWFWHHQSPAWIDQGHQRCRVKNCACKSCRLWKGGPVTSMIT